MAMPARPLGEMGALRAITIDAAKISGVEERLGSLKEGKDADIVIYEGNPLEIKGTAIFTIVDGKVVWEKDKVQFTRDYTG